MTEPGGPPPVVVGVDGSTQSLAALSWAEEYARLVGAPVRAVIAWEQATGFGFVPEPRAGFEDEARRTLEGAVRKALGPRAEAVQLEVVEGRPSEVLVHRSRSARLLVVGDRGYSVVAGLLLGHCGEACVRRAACSVVVVRANAASGSS